MPTRPQIRINTTKFISGTRRLNAEEIGALILLACHRAWHGTLPEGDVALAEIVGLSVRRWKNIRHLVLGMVGHWESCFEFRGDGRAWQAALDAPRPPDEIWRELRAVVFERDGYVCTYCGDAAANLECDHIVPVIKGGPSVLSNLTTACFRCNRSKGRKTVEEWLG